MTPSRPLTHRSAGNVPPLEYRAFVPTSVRTRHALVVVHGASRDAAAQFRAFLPSAIAHGIPVLGPVFSAESFPRYQRLAGGAGPLAAAEALVQVLADAHQELGLPTDRVHLMGFSGGAQFAHRFALLHPEHVRSAVLASAGWFTMLDTARRFPYGVRPPEQAPDAHLDVDAFLKLPVHLLVGERDVRRDRRLRTNGSVDRRQGRHRLARALTWIDHVEAVAARAGLPSLVSFDLHPGAGHSFREAVVDGGLVERVVDFALAVEAATPVRSLSGGEAR